jgi:hypothetical protein
MLQKLDRIAVVVVSLVVGLQAIVPGWTIMADGSVYGFRLPASWLTDYWPFDGYFVAGLILLVVVGFGSLMTAAVAAVNQHAYPVVTLLMGFVLVGWIAGELVFMNETMVMTWIILASGLVLIALSAPYAVRDLGVFARGGRRQAA